MKKGLGNKWIWIIMASAAVVIVAAVLGLTLGHREGSISGGHSSGEIFLYGETHSVKTLLEKEMEQWAFYYENEGMRDLFVELPFYTAEFLNLWMRSENDEILEQLYVDWEKTAIHTQEVLDFYRQIKKDCPETVFHGTDVGHQYETTGKRYLEYLAANGLEHSEAYRLAQENVEQGEYYYRRGSGLYRENTMTKNFVRAFDSLDGLSVMGIYGSAHTELGAKDYYTNTVPCMANQLTNIYGDRVHSEDLSYLLLRQEADRVDTILVEGKEYEASYFGKTDLSVIFPDFQYREFWRLENAYDDFKSRSTTGNVLPYNNYPMEIEEGHVFVIQYTKKDGTVIREYHRSDGNTWQGAPATEEFKIQE